MAIKQLKSEERWGKPRVREYLPEEVNLDSILAERLAREAASRLRKQAKRLARVTRVSESEAEDLLVENEYGIILEHLKKEKETKEPKEKPTGQIVSTPIIIPEQPVDIVIGEPQKLIVPK